MKKILSFFLAMILTLAPMAVLAEDAALGTAENPYLLSAGAMTPLGVTVEPGCDATVKVDDCDNSVVTVGFATGDGYFLQYGRQTVYPAADGTCELTMNTFSDTFMIVNTGDTAITLRLMLAAGAPKAEGTMDNPAEIILEQGFMGDLSAYVSQELPAGSEGYYYVWHATEKGYFSVSVSAFDADYEMMDWMFCVNNITAGIYGDNHYSDDEEIVYVESVAVNPGDEVVIFANTYNPANMWNSPAGFIGVGASFATVGSVDFPADVDLGEHTTELPYNNQGYYYSWIAQESGLITVSMKELGWIYSVDVHGADGESFVYGDYHWSDDDPVIASESFAVKAGDKVVIMVSTYDPENMWANPEGSVSWELSFVPGEYSDEPETPDEPEIPELLEGYYFSDTYIELGSNFYPLDTEYAYTVYTFEPSEIGEYTFTAGALMGIVSYNGMWVTEEPTPETITEYSVTWSCESVGQSILIAVQGGYEEVAVSVTMEEIVVDEIPVENYENKTELNPFTFQGDPDELIYVDTYDNTLDTAVLGKDGFYHLNSANGPILYVDLNDSLMSLADATNYGQLKYVLYDGDVAILKIDYNEAFIAYMDNADAETMLYPLTEDLITIYQNVGKSHGWYGEDGWVGGELEDAWMFACLYLEQEEPEYLFGDVDGNGKLSSVDYAKLKRHILGTYILTDDELSRADISGDGKLSAVDYAMLKRYILGVGKP